MEARTKVRVVNASGLHARPCHAVVALAAQFRCELVIRHGPREVNGKSILQLMTLGASQDAELELEARGEDAQACLERVSALIASGFDDFG